MTRKSHVRRIALYLVLLVLVMTAVVNTVWAKYVGNTASQDRFDIYVTAGTIDLQVAGGQTGIIVVPGTYISTESQTQVKLGKNSEPCFVFVKIDKTANVKDILEVNVRDTWIALPGHAGVYYQELTRSDITDTAGTKEYANYPVFVNKNQAIWVSPTATKAQIQAIRAGEDKITFTAYAVQKTPGITDAAAAWAKLNA